MDSTVHQEDINCMVECAHRQLCDRTGNWETYLVLARPEVDKYRQGGSIHMIAWGNYHMVNSLLEMNRFTAFSDLSEVEERMKENIEINWLRYYAYLKLVIVYARLEQFSTAHNVLLQAEEYSYTVEHNGAIQARTSAEFELAYAEKRWNDAVKFSEITKRQPTFC